MKLPSSKFEANENVWFYNDWEGPRFLEGVITSVARWENGNGIFYAINHINAAGEPYDYDVNEKDIYRTQAEVGEAIFVSNGTPAAQPGE